MSKPFLSITLQKEWTHRLGRFTELIALIGFCGLVILCFLTFYDGTARAIGAPRFSGFSDYGSVIYPIVIASCFPAGLLRQSNISVNLFAAIQHQGFQCWLETFAALVTLIFFALMSWQFIEMTVYYGTNGRISQTIEIPLAPWWWITTTLICLCVFVQLFILLTWLSAAISGQPHIPSTQLDHEPSKDFE